MTKLAPLLCVSLLAVAAPAAETPPDDPHLWLEEVTGEKALAWVRAQNAVSQRELESSPDFQAIRERLLSIYDSKARIPYLAKRGEYFYNFWRDSQHVRGIWRRTTLAQYRKPEPAWETVLDLDALAAAEKENWVWKGVNWLEPGFERCLLNLSRGGADATVVREFDPVAKAFVPDGFTVAEAKSDLTWRDRDTVYVGTNFGAGSLTDSGYPRVVKEWKRGTPLAAARLVFEGQAADVAVGTSRSTEPGFEREFLRRAITFYSGESFLRVGATFTKLDLPPDAEQGTFRDFITVTLRTPWAVGGKTYPAGALLAQRWDRFLAGERSFDILFQPTPRSSLDSVTATRHHLIVNELANVRNRLFVLTPRAEGGWTRAALATPEFGKVTATAVDERSDDYFLTVTDFLTPTSYAFGTIGKDERELLKQLPAFFRSEGLAISQHEATSADGTRVPYFQVASKGLALNGSHPTLLYGYGGFEVSETPNYSGGIGSAWLERGGIFILANIRGGGEFGPGWHQAALKDKRQRAYDDFIAVADDLIKRKVTSPRHLGIQGGSNGGLLVGAVFTQRPELFNAVVCQVPLLDMRRYHKLLAGASWMGEYGNPDVPAEWEYIRKYSPYHNVRAGVKYPRVLITTSTRDDRVHPAHARKMVARMAEQRQDVLYYENIEGGHGGAANNQQQAYMNALAFTFLLKQLK